MSDVTAQTTNDSDSDRSLQQPQDGSSVAAGRQRRLAARFERTLAEDLRREMATRRLLITGRAGASGCPRQR